MFTGHCQFQLIWSLFIAISISYPAMAFATLAVLMPTKDGLIVATDTRAVLQSASLGVSKLCDDESKLVELANVERTVVAIVGVRRLLFPRSVLSAQNPCLEIKRVSVGLDARKVTSEYLDRRGARVVEAHVRSFSNEFLRKVNSLDLSPMLSARAMKSLFQITVASYDIRTRKSLIGSFGIYLTREPAAIVRDFEWEEVSEDEVKGAIIKGEVDYLKRQVLNGPGKKYLGQFSFHNRAVGTISAKEAMVFAVNIIDATIKTMEELQDSNTVGGKIDVLLVGKDKKPVRLK
jgi:hypothetical protein